MAHELTRCSASDSVERLIGGLSDAEVDLNAHQIEAALFAFHSPVQLEPSAWRPLLKVVRPYSTVGCQSLSMARQCLLPLRTEIADQAL